MLDNLLDLWPVGTVVLAAALLGWGVQRFFAARPSLATRFAFLRAMLMAILAGGGLVALVLALPIDDRMKTHMLSVLGLVVSAAITLSSTTLVGNAMAGLMLRTMGRLRRGDFLAVGEHLGRITEVGVLHVEIQTEESRLTTFSNLYLVTQPYTVLRAEGTVVAAEVSLGYDVPHPVAERLLAEAATDAGLEEPYVQVMALGDYAVTYRAAGMLKEAKDYLAARSRLRVRMLDRLHEGGVEIVSPSFMNQRRLDPAGAIIPDPPSPRRAGAHDAETVADGPPEEVVFGKAERAALVEELHDRLADGEEEIRKLQAERKEAAEEADRKRIDAALDRKRVYVDFLKARLERARDTDGGDA